VRCAETSRADWDRTDRHSHSERHRSHRKVQRQLCELPPISGIEDYSRKPGFTATRLRPLARRRERTARPVLVFIRVRNPCVFERRRRLGWNVRLGMKNKCSCSVCDAHHSVHIGKQSINDAAQGGKLA
jgi:hypothetical protein